MMEHQAAADGAPAPAYGDQKKVASEFYDPRTGRLISYHETANQPMEEKIDNNERVMAVLRQAAQDLRRQLNSSFRAATRQAKGQGLANKARSFFKSSSRSNSREPDPNQWLEDLKEENEDDVRKEETEEEEEEDDEPPSFAGGKFPFHLSNAHSQLISEGLPTELAEELLLEFGRNELPEKVEPKWIMFFRLLVQPMPMMIWAVMILDASLQRWADAGILLAIQLLNAALSYYEMTRAKNAVAALKQALKPTAEVKRDGRWKRVDAALLVPGDLVRMARGSAVPADCNINSGTIQVDQFTLNADATVKQMGRGEKPLMGSMVVLGEAEATVEATGKDTYIGRAAALMNTGQARLSRLDRIISQVMSILVVLSIVLCTSSFVYLIKHGRRNVQEALGFTVVLLVASIPMAIEIVCTTTLALGSRQLAKVGAIVSRLGAIEDMAGMTILCTDKTGTLTQKKMEIQEECIIYSKSETRKSLLRYAAMATKWFEEPIDPLDQVVIQAVDDISTLDGVQQLNYVPLGPIHKRTEGTVRLLTGEVFQATKGAPYIVMDLMKSDSEEAQAFRKRVEDDVEGLANRGIRALAVAKTDPQTQEWELLGVLTFLDPPRPDSKATIEELGRYGVEVKMITGDHLLVARKTARQLGMSEAFYGPEGLPRLGYDGVMPPELMDYLDLVESAAGFAHVYPEQKALAVEILARAGYKVGMVGDGVNDAAALRHADVGIAVLGATDVAKAAADIVLTKPGLSAIVTGVRVSRKVFRRMHTFMKYRIAATLQLLFFFFIAVLSLSPSDFQPKELEGIEEWPDFFGLPVLLMMLITLLNDGTLISIGYDEFKSPSRPERWNLRLLFAVASVLALVACFSSLLLLYIALDSWNPHGIWMKAFRLPSLTYGQITTMIYLKVSISDFLTLFSARSRDKAWWRSRPSKALLIAMAVSCSTSTIVANVWPHSMPDHIPTYGLAFIKPREMSLYVWIYCILFFFIQDGVKLFAYSLLRGFDLIGANKTAKLPPPVDAFARV